LIIHRRSNPKINVDLSIKPIFDEAGTLQFIIVEGRDITELKHTSEALFQSEARFKTIFEKAGIGIVIKNVDGIILDCNPTFQAMLGYSSEALRQLSYQQITHPLDRSASRKLFNALVKGKRRNYFIEKRYLTRDQEEVWCRVTASIVDGANGQAQYVIAMVENFSTQKQIEAELAEMRQYVMRGREAERLRLAQDLHDGPLQEIIGVSYQIKDIKNAVSGDAELEQLLSIQTTLDRLTQSIRAICGELRPPTLIPFGLEKTILSHVEQFKTSHPELNIELSLGEEGQRLPEPVRIALFRIYQETFNNIVRHAQASNVWVGFWLNDELAFLEIRDDGIGFQLPSRWIRFARQGHLGLVGAMERASEVGGNLDIETSPGKGTQIRAIVPLNGARFPGSVAREEEKL
jgi:PAS domain S-box-containing protein